MTFSILLDFSLIINDRLYSGNLNVARITVDNWLDNERKVY